MTRLTSRMVKVAFFMVVVLPAVISGCTNNVWSSAALTAVDTGVATLSSALATAIAERFFPTVQ